MKCKCRLVYISKNGKNFKTPKSFSPDASVLDIVEIIHERGCKIVKTETCDGHITATVQAITDSYDDAEIRVTYRCEKCNSTHRYDFPDEYQLSEFLTKWIEEL